MTLFNDIDYEQTLSSLSQINLIGVDLNYCANKLAKTYGKINLETGLCQLLSVTEQDAKKIAKIINHELAMAKVNNPLYQASSLVLEKIIESALLATSACPIANMESNINWQQAFDYINNTIS